MKNYFRISYWVFFTSVFILVMAQAKAQESFLKGRVESSNEKPFPIEGALVKCIETNEVVTTNKSGEFSFFEPHTFPVTVTVVMISFDSLSLRVDDANTPLLFKLKENNELNEVDIVGKRRSTEMSTIQTRSSELITDKELLKAACCNLSESFETNPSIDVNYSDAVTGAKEIQLLGLSGIYSQFLSENIPNLRGIALPFGLAYIPGPWMQSIQISKGAGSVTNGYDAISGQINIEYLSPEKADPFFVNAFADNDGRFELNTINNIKINDKLSDLIFFNASYNNRKNDHNSDGFLDQPRLRSINMMNKLMYHSGKNLEGQFIVRALYEDRVGGQVDFDKDTDKLNTNSYGALFTTKRIETILKTGLIFPETPWKSIGWQNAFIVHDLNSSIGLRSYLAQQQSFYSNLAYQTILGTTEHKIKSGLDFKYDYLTESLVDSGFNTNEIVPGAYSEYSFSKAEGFGIVAGARVDYHNNFGWLFSPRLNMKYSFNCETILRISGGKGYRTPRVYADNLGLFVSSKELVVLEQPRIEEGWNSGINFTKSFQLLGHDAIIAADLYYSWFQNQLVVDQYSRNDAVLFYNLKGNSSSTSFQLVFTYELIENLDIKLAFKADDVKSDYLIEDNLTKPLVAKNRGLINLAYQTPRKTWRFDTTIQLDGIKQLPLAAYGSTHQHGDGDYTSTSSQSYMQLMAQVTKVFKKWEIYLGGENLLDYTQHNPILNATNPFEQGFDATRVWGPLMDRKIYAGVRVTFK